MNKVLIIVISSFCIISSAIAQNNKMQDHCKLMPMKAGDIIYSKETSGSHNSNTFIVSSTKNEVYSLAPGKVAAVVHFPGKDYQAVGINYAGDTVIEYTMLMDVSVKQGDNINKGDMIGKAMPNGKSGKSEAAIEIKIPRKGK